METQLPVPVIDGPTIGTPIADLEQHASQASMMPVRWGSSWRLLATGLPLLCVDVAAIGLAVVIGGYATEWLGLRFSLAEETAWSMLPLAICITLGAGLYPGTGFHPAKELRKVVMSVLWTVAVLALIQLASATSSAESAGVWVLLSAIVGLPLTLGARAVARHFLAKQAWWGEPAFVIGTSDQAAGVVESLMRNPRLGFRPQRVNRDGDGSARDYLVSGLGISEHVQRSQTRVAVLYAGDFIGQEATAILNECASCIPRLIVIPEFVTSLPVIGRGPWRFSSWPKLEIRQPLLFTSSRWLKRAMDIAVVVGTAAVTIPAVVVLAVLIKCTSRGPVFFKHRRIGKSGRIFFMWKFRTMVVNSEQVLHECLAKDPELRREWDQNHKLKNDPRVTLAGRLLRKTSLDELPQLGNVLLGQMSLVGPRPIVVSDEGKRYLVEYPESYNEYRKMSPGITGLWQVLGRNQTTYAERVNLEAYYVRNWSLWLDLYILARTGMVVVRGRGAY